LRGISTVIALAAMALAPSTAIAQTAQPRVSVAVGGGVANPYHGDFDFTAPSWDVSFRASIARHVAIEGFFEQWQHDTREVFLNQAIQGPTGVIGRIARYEQRTTYLMRTAGFHALATGRSGRVTFAGGGGIGELAYDREFTTTATGCDAGTANLCRSTENTFSSNSFTVQGVAEMDVAVVRRVSAFARYLMVVPVSDPGFGHSSLGAGVRIVLF
jgi:hypothetical protein